MGRKCPDMRTVAIKRVLLCERFQKEQKEMTGMYHTGLLQSFDLFLTRVYV